jgi:NAD(P)-dependent dehydrogenase (short-subunit alcohol dehydrogenase family)
VKLEGKVALVTGGGGAMGGAQCRLFAEEGAAVCVTDIFLEKAQAVADDIESAGGKAIAVRLEVQRADEWAEAVARTEAELGPISILCNNAGANFRVGFDNQTEEQWNIVVGSMLTGSFLGIKATIPSMRRAGGGVISTSGRSSIRPGAVARLRGRQGRAGRADPLGGGSYAADNIRCVLVSPGTSTRRSSPGEQPVQPERRLHQHRQSGDYERRLRSTPRAAQTAEDIANRAVRGLQRRRMIPADDHGGRRRGPPTTGRACVGATQARSEW